MDQQVNAYIDAVDAEYRPLFDHVFGLILEACPDAEVVISYKMPTFKRGKRKLHLAAWSHGVSLYGWPEGGDAGFADRHPRLRSGVRTLRIRPQDAQDIADEEFRAFARAALGA